MQGDGVEHRDARIISTDVELVAVGGISRYLQEDGMRQSRCGVVSGQKSWLLLWV